MIKTDPSQTKAVVVLLLVLGGAVVATVLRIHPDSARPAAVAAAAADTTREREAPRVTVTAGPTSRNPFRKPQAISAAFSREAKQGIVFTTNSAQGGNAGANSSQLDVARFGSLPAGAINARPTNADQAKTEEPKPQFALLATVSGPNGLTAVIRVGDSTTRVVGVGDTLDGHYKVAKLEQGRAVLKNGSDVIEVKRPS